MNPNPSDPSTPRSSSTPTTSTTSASTTQAAALPLLQVTNTNTTPTTSTAAQPSTSAAANVVPALAQPTGFTLNRPPATLAFWRSLIDNQLNRTQFFAWFNNLILTNWQFPNDQRHRLMHTARSSDSNVAFEALNEIQLQNHIRWVAHLLIHDILKVGRLNLQIRTLTRTIENRNELNHRARAVNSINSYYQRAYEAYQRYFTQLQIQDVNLRARMLGDLRKDSTLTVHNIKAATYSSRDKRIAIHSSHEIPLNLSFINAILAGLRDGQAISDDIMLQMANQFVPYVAPQGAAAGQASLPAPLAPQARTRRRASTAQPPSTAPAKQMRTTVGQLSAATLQPQTASTSGTAGSSATRQSTAASTSTTTPSQTRPVFTAPPSTSQPSTSQSALIFPAMSAEDSSLLDDINALINQQTAQSSQQAAPSTSGQSTTAPATQASDLDLSLDIDFSALLDSDSE